MEQFPPHEYDPSVAYSHLTATPVELAGGVDALHLSGRTVLPQPFLDRLEEFRSLADAASATMPFELGGEIFGMAPHAFGRYRYCLEHPDGRIEISSSPQLPAVRIQPRSAYLHTVGPTAAATRFQQTLEAECTEVELSVSRIDLHADFDGWNIGIADRERFVCRAGSVRTYEEENRFTGFEFGRRSTKTICARIYDKTADVARTGSDWRYDNWRREPGSVVVMRVEFEWNREGLAQFGFAGVDETLAAAGSLWRYSTEERVSHRAPMADSNRSRWPVSPGWATVQAASLAQHAVRADRVHQTQRSGSHRRLAPALVGYLVAFATLSGTTGIDEMVSALARYLRYDEVRRGVDFADRVRRRLAERRFR
jgi:hypothetical protein